jgi:glycosyltransferase involved in cell wall biosynthesis
MEILYIPTKDPRLTNGGNEQRTNLLWESLKRYGKVYTFLHDPKLDTYAEMVEGEHPIYKTRPVENRISFWRIVNSFLSRLSLISICSRKTTKIKSPEKVFPSVQFDLVVARYIHPLCEFNYWEIAPLLIDIDDHPQQVYETVRRKRLPWGLKTIGYYVTKWQANYLIGKSVGGWIANQEQEIWLGDSFTFLPNIPQMPSSSYNQGNTQRKDLFTVGAMGYGPNKDGVTRFLKDIWPSFHKCFPEVKYYIVGKGASDEDARMWSSVDGVEYLGFVENLESLYENTLATVVPVYSGGGTCIKTLEAMAFSRTCLSTEFGARGLSEDVIKEEKGIMIFKDAVSFIDAYKKIQDTSLRDIIEARGRETIMVSYSVDSFNGAVDEVIKRVVK